MPAPPSIVPLEAHEHRDAAALLARAFHDDPMFEYLAPDDGGRRVWVNAFFAATVRALLPERCLVRVGGLSGGGIIGVTPPGRYPPPTGRELRGVVSLLPALLRSGPGFVRRVRAVGLLREMSSRHPAEPHWYLHPLGVDSEGQGRGLGGALMRHALAVVADSPHPLFLETSNPVNLTFYERFGFSIQDTYPTPRGRPPMWSMIRPAG